MLKVFKRYVRLRLQRYCVRTRSRINSHLRELCKRKSARVQTHERTRTSGCTQAYACTIAAFAGTQHLCRLLYARNHAKARTNAVGAGKHACRRTYTDACARADERMQTQFMFFCVGGECVRTRSDADVSFENFQDVLYNIHWAEDGQGFHRQ